MLCRVTPFQVCTHKRPPVRPPFDNIPTMCGRMTLSRRELAELADELDAMPVAGAADVYRPRYNVAPTDTHPIVRLDGTGRRLLPAVWGFSNAPGRPPLFNARAETAAIKDSFRDAFVNGRCVVPADGFYEWAGTGQDRRPFWLHRAAGKLLLFAGLYEQSAIAGARFTVLTTGPNTVVAQLHDRMPVILAPDQVDRWLRRGDPGLLQPAPDDLLVVTPVSARVNSVRNDDPACLEPPGPESPPPAKRQLDLF
jgi:putative SOS response-associated peptidase YedK